MLFIEGRQVEVGMKHKRYYSLKGFITFYKFFVSVLSISGDVAVYVGNSIGFGFFFKRFLYFAIVLIGTYFLVVYCEKACEKVLAIKASSLTGLAIALSCAVILIRSFTFSSNSFDKTIDDLSNVDYSQVRGVMNIENEIENYLETIGELFDFSEGFYY